MGRSEEIYESWEPLFNPRSVAVVGASNGLGKWGFIVPMNLVTGGYPGELYMINPKEKSVQGLPTFKSLSEVGKPIDLVLVTIPAPLVLETIEECAAIGTKNLVVISSGFSEMSEEGKELEKRLTGRAREHGLRLIGPNTMGICSPPTKLYPMGSFTHPPAGHVAFLSQSGNLGVQLLGWAARSGLGISRFIGSGNEAVVTCDQILEFYGADPETRVIIMYLEGIDYGSRFLSVARRVTPHKPVIALKMGMTDAGARAAASHSGAVSTPHRVYQAMARQAGILEAASTEEMVNLARTFGHLPVPKGRRVGIMTMGGGWGVVTTDHCAKAGLTLPKPAPNTIDEINQVLPEFWSHGNPVDLVGTMNRAAHYKVLEAMVHDPNFDSIITLGSLTGVQFNRDPSRRRQLRQMGRNLLKRHGLGIFRFYLSLRKSLWNSFRPARPKTRTQEAKKQSGGINLREARKWRDHLFGKEIRRLIRSSAKPIVPVPFDPTSVTAIFQRLELVAFGVPEEAVVAIAKLADYNDFLERHRAEQERLDREAPDDDIGLAIQSQLQGRAGPLTEEESKTILTHYGIDVTRGLKAAGPEQAAAAARELGFPVALKVDSPDIAHKTDAGGVALNLKSEDEVRAAYEKIMANCKAYSPQARIHGVAVQEMVTGGTEVLVGISRDPHYGHTIVFGLGGVFVEALDDVSLRILPIAPADAEAMLSEIKGKKVLAGLRGQKPRDLTALAEAIQRIGDLAWDLRHRIVEMDVNPLVVFEEGKGVKALDALIVLNDKPEPETELLPKEPYDAHFRA